MCPGSQGARGPVPPLGCAFGDDLLLLIVGSRRQFHQRRFCVEALNCVWDPGNRPIGPYCVMKLFTRMHEHTTQAASAYVRTWLDLSQLFINLGWEMRGRGVVMIHYGEVTGAADGWRCQCESLWIREGERGDTFTKWPRRTNMAAMAGSKCFATDEWRDICKQALGMSRCMWHNVLIISKLVEQCRNGESTV